MRSVNLYTFVLILIWSDSIFVRTVKIYTKTGDDGTTGLLSGERLPKYHLRIEAYGTVDELNAHLGVVADSAHEEGVTNQLRIVQHELFTIGSQLAAGATNTYPLPNISEDDITRLERWMDEMDTELVPLTNFILPGGHIAVSNAHVARCICRRAERLVVALSQDETIDTRYVRYLNRLSDYLFVLARYITHLKGAEELKWVPKK